MHTRTVSDAGGTEGFGIVFGDQVIQGRWTQARAASPNIAVQEILPMLVALEHIAPQAAGKIVILTTDNAGNAFAINKGTCRSPAAFFLRSSFFLNGKMIRSKVRGVGSQVILHRGSAHSTRSE